MRISTRDLIDRLDLRSSIASIACPLWLCYGGSDLVVPLADVREIHHVAPPGTPLVVVPRATHLSLPIEPAALSALAGWLTQEANRCG